MRRRDFLASGSLSLLPAPALDQCVRRAQIYELHRRAALSLFDATGVWTAAQRPIERREQLWHSMSFLAHASARDLGNRVLRQFLAAKHERDHFVHLGVVQILLQAAGALDQDVKTALLDLLAKALKQGEGTIRFGTANDNFPSMETAYSILGATLTGCAPARERGREAMEQAHELLTRRGMLTEYSSPTYTPISLLAFAEIAEHAVSAGERSLAAAIENRIWLDIAAHWHHPTNTLAGPHSRAYTVDSVGHFHQAQMVIDHVFAGRLWMTPERNLFPPAARQEIHHDVPFMQASNVWMASGTYHPRPEIGRVLFDKRYPYCVTATSEFGLGRAAVIHKGASARKTAEPFEYPAGDLIATTYHGEDYSVGSATAQYHDGYQTDAFFVSFARSRSPRSLADVSTIFCRYASDNAGPGVAWSRPENNGRNANAHLFADEGRVRAVQKGSTVLAAYQAKGQIHGAFSSLRLTIVVPAFYRRIAKIQVGSESVRALPHTSVDPAIVWLEDELLLAAFRPLECTKLGRAHAVRIAEQNGYLTISFINYDGAPKDFSRQTLHRTSNGFVAEIASRREIAPEAFRERVLAGRVSDEISSQQRLVDYRRAGVQLGVGYSLLSGGLKYAVVDGRTLAGTRFQGPGITEAMLEL